MSRTKYYINSFPILFFIQEVVDKCVAAEIEMAPEDLAEAGIIIG